MELDCTTLETPCLVLDRGKLERNISTMADRFAGRGIHLRPHLKTPKSVDVARLLQDHGAERFTVSTLKEAEYFAGAGFKDMLYAVSIVPAKLGRIAVLNRRVADVAVGLDSVETARELASAQIDGPPLRVFVEVDVDHHRTGVRAEEPRVLEIGRILSAAAHLNLAGVFAHGGGSYGSSSIDEIRSAAANEQATTLAVAEALRGNGFACPHVSVGSTPTCTFGEEFDGITEVRPGVYVFQDLCQSNLGVCDMEDIAVTVLATVVSHSRAMNRMVIDAGGLALSKDRSTASQVNDCGYGLIADKNGKLQQALFVDGVSQEHGYVTTRDNSPLEFDAYPIGTVVRVLPNHICMTAAAHDGYHVVENGTVTGYWPRVNGW